MEIKGLNLLIRLVLLLSTSFSFQVVSAGEVLQIQKAVSTKDSSSQLTTKNDQATLGNARVQRHQKPLLSRQKSLKNKVNILHKSTSVSPRASFFSIYDAWVSLDKDYDGDGYYSEVSINIDADYEGVSANVLMAIYVSLDGENWELFDTSEVFTIYSDESTIDSLSFDLKYGYPTGHYQFLIELYEEGRLGTVAVVQSSDLVGLADKPIEDKEYESGDYTSINYVASEQRFDQDYDEYYTRLILEYDIETTEAGKRVYAQVVISDRATGEQTAVYTENFTLGNQTEVIEIDFDSGYFPSNYDVQINVVDALSDEIIAYAGEDFVSLNKLDIESVDHDNYDDSGSLGILIGWLLLTLLVIRFLSDNKKDKQ